MLTKTLFWQTVLLLIGTTVALEAYSARPRITKVMDVPESADTPYENILIIALFSQFDSRRRLEKAVVNELAKRGTKATASTSLMDTKTPVTRKVFADMLDELDSDSVLVTQLVDLDSQPSMAPVASPEATYKVRPTYYFNVWEVNLTEYVEPPVIEVKSTFVLSTELYSVQSQEEVWVIESKTKLVAVGGARENYMVFVDEGEAIVKQMWKDKLIKK